MPAMVVGGAMGLINAIGNLGGYLGPFLGGYLPDLSNGGFLTTAILLAGSLLAAGLAMLTIRLRHGPTAIERA